MMIRFRVIALVIGALAAGPANAGLYADDLGRCLVAKTNAPDQTMFMRWFYSAMSSSAAAANMSTVTDAQHREYNKAAADLFTRLLTVDCHAQAVAALRNEGMSSVESSFALLGQVAGRGLMSDPSVQQQMRAFGALLDGEKLKSLRREAGLPGDLASPAAKAK